MKKKMIPSINKEKGVRLYLIKEVNSFAI